MSSTKEALTNSSELTPLSRELNADLFYKYYQEGMLGLMELTIPGVMKIKVELDKLFEHITNLKSSEDRTAPDNIEAICVYGSALYRHFGTEETLRQERRKWVLFGPKQVETRTFTRYKTPRDFDILVILKEGLTDDKVVVPKRTLIRTRTALVNIGYGASVEHIKSDGSSGILTSIPVVNEYGYIERFARGEDLDLHICYRSVEQFTAGLGQGDELSESVVRYGVPLVGQERFNALVGSVNFERAPLHSVHPFEDLQGKLQIKIK